MLSLLYGPTLTSIHDHWKNHSFDYMDFCQQSDFSAVEYFAEVCYSFSSKQQVSFNFMAAVTIRSDFGAQESEFYHCFHFPPSIFQEFYLAVKQFPCCLPAGKILRWGRLMEYLGHTHSWPRHRVGLS